MKPMKRVAVIVVAVMAAIAIGGIAWASIPGPDGVIHGCYKTSNPATGSVIVIDHTASCPSGFAPLNWNQTGPQGPQGPSGVLGFYTISDERTGTSTGNIGSATLCNIGDVATGAGIHIYEHGQMDVQSLEPSPTDSRTLTWQVWLYAAPTSWRVSLQCADVTP